MLVIYVHKHDEDRACYNKSCIENKRLVEVYGISNLVKAIGVNRRHYVTMFKEHGNMN